MENVPYVGIGEVEEALKAAGFTMSRRWAQLKIPKVDGAYKIKTGWLIPSAGVESILAQAKR